MVDIPFWKKGKTKREGELINTPFALVLKRSEKEWIKSQAKFECTSSNSIVRKSIKLYKSKIESNQ